jgi:predicted small secreted protein
MKKKLAFSAVLAIALVLAFTLAFTACDTGGVSDDIGSLGNALYTIINKYVRLDLSDSSFTSIGNSAFSDCTSLTSVTFATGSNIQSTNFGSYTFPEGSSTDGVGDSLRIAYITGEAGTYTRPANGTTWTKQ